MGKFHCNHIIISSRISHSSHISYSFPLTPYVISHWPPWIFAFFIYHHNHLPSTSIVHHPLSSLSIDINHLHQHLLYILDDHQHPTTTLILSIIHHPSSIINNTIQHLSSTSILYIIYHPSSPINNNNINPSQHPASISITTSSINIHHPASINNTNTIQYHLLYHQISRSTSINIHHQHLYISRFASLYHLK